MKSCCLALGLLTCLPAFAAGQGTENAPLDLTATPPAFTFEVAPTPSRPWALHLLLGLPTGIRLQCALDEEHAWLVEGFGGIEIILPMLGGGVRRNLPLACGQAGTLSLRPGLGAYLLLNVRYFGFGDDDGYLALAADTELVWQFGRGEFGLRLGAAAAFGSGWGVLPLGGLFFGFRF